MRENKLSKFEGICFILICMINEIILNIPQNFIITTGTGALINLIIISIITFLFCFFISKLFKNFSNSDLIDISEFVGGKILKFIIGFIFILFFILLASLAISHFSHLIKTIYFHKSPILFVFMFFIFGMLVANILGFNSIKKTACLIIPFSIISLIILSVNSFDEFTLYRLTPILGKNIKTTFLSGLINISSFSIVIYYYFITPFLINKKDHFKIIKYTLLISFILIGLLIIAILTRFSGFGNSETINSVYMLTRSISLSDFLQRVDALFILLWIISLYIYLSILLFWTIHIFGKLFNIKNKKSLSYSFSFLILGLTILFFNTNFLDITKTNTYKFICISIIFGIGFIILCIANIKKKKSNPKIS